MFFISLILTFYINNDKYNMIFGAFLSNITVLAIFSKIFFKTKIDSSLNFKNIMKYFIFSLSITFSLEIFLFNFRHFESLSYNEIFLNDINILDGLTEVEDNIYKVDQEGKYYLEILNINHEIKNVDIELENLLDVNEIFDIKLNVTDEANKEYFGLPEYKYCKKIDGSYIHHLHLSGKTDKILIELELNDNGLYKINNISINKKVPLMIEPLRMIFIFVIILLCFFFRPKSDLYKIKAIDYKKTMPIILTFIISEMFLLIVIVNLNPTFYEPDFLHHNQYNMLAESFSKGKLSLDYPVSDTLKQMDNPYDTNERAKLNLVENIDFLWDASFYNGRYYVYFGVVPVLTFYLPYYLITGNYLSNQVVVAIIGILTMFSSVYLIYSIIKRWFKKTSVGIFILLALLFVSSSGLFYIMKRPDLYSVPIVYSMLLTTFGLSLWINAYKNNKLSMAKLFIGSLCMALVAGCRPQFLLGSFFVIPMYYRYFFKEKWNKRKTYEILSLILPYVIVAIPLMIYNYLRFSSPFDFGANYNLTTNDMTKRGFFCREYLQDFIII